MLSLDSPSWSALHHAYGSAENIPALLKQLAHLPVSEGEAEPWFSLWSSLAHQGNVYSASFAAVPHVVQALASEPSKACSSYFQFPAWVEICRQKQGIEVPPALRPAYSEALSKIPALVAAASSRLGDEGFLRCALAAIAAAKGFGTLAEATLELSPEVASEFMEWIVEK